MSTKHARWLVIPVLLALAYPIACRDSGDGDGQATGIGPEGGSVEFGSVTLEVEAGTFTEETIIEIQRTTSAPAGHIGAAYDFGPEGITFAPPVTLRFGYTEAVLGDTVPSKLTIATAVDGVWMPVESIVDVEMGEVRASLTHFSIYGLIDRTGPADGDADTDVDSDSDTDVDSDSDTDVDSDSDTDVDSDSDTDVDSDSDSDADVECTHGTCEWSSGYCSCEWDCEGARAYVWCNVFTEPFGCDCDGDEELDCFITGSEPDPCGDDLCCNPVPH